MLIDSTQCQALKNSGVGRAYQVLSDSAQHQAYDAFGKFEIVKRSEEIGT